MQYYKNSPPNCASVNRVPYHMQKVALTNANCIRLARLFTHKQVSTYRSGVQCAESHEPGTPFHGTHRQDPSNPRAAHLARQGLSPPLHHFIHASGRVASSQRVLPAPFPPPLARLCKPHLRTGTLRLLRRCWK